MASNTDAVKFSITVSHEQDACVLVRQISKRLIDAKQERIAADRRRQMWINEMDRMKRGN